MTDEQFYNKFMQVLDKGIALYTEALNTERGDDRKWLEYNGLEVGLCFFFCKNDLDEVGDWIQEAIGDVLICWRGLSILLPRHERFAKRLAILKQIKKELE